MKTNLLSDPHPKDITLDIVKADPFRALGDRLNEIIRTPFCPSGQPEWAVQHWHKSHMVIPFGDVVELWRKVAMRLRLEGKGAQVDEWQSAIDGISAKLRDGKMATVSMYKLAQEFFDAAYLMGATPTPAVNGTPATARRPKPRKIKPGHLSIYKNWLKCREKEPHLSIAKFTAREIRSMNSVKVKQIIDNVPRALKENARRKKDLSAATCPA